jgi:hypothetical protein
MSLTNHSLDVRAQESNTVSFVINCEHDECVLIDGERIAALADGNEAEMVFCQSCVQNVFGSMEQFGNYYESATLDAYIGTYDTDDHALYELVAL